MKKYLLTLFILFSSGFFYNLYAQSQFSGWLASFNTFKTGKKTSIHADVQLRSSDEFDHIQTLLLRTGLNIHLNKKLVVTAGYAFVSNYRTVGSVHGYAPEQRIWEQLLYNHKLKSIFVSHRLRIEQRFISKTYAGNNQLKTNGYAYANRCRYFIRNILPFKKQPVFTKGFFAALQDEVFFNVGNTTPVNGKFFDQNRLYLAAGYRINKSVDIEAGYIYQYINGRAAAFTRNHVIQIATYLRL